MGGARSPRLPPPPPLLRLRGAQNYRNCSTQAARLHPTAPAVFPADPEGRLNVLGPRALFAGIHAAGLAYALYRVHLMGLLPTRLADWAGALRAGAPAERAVAGLLGRPAGL
jgi:hypothetical protein